MKQPRPACRALIQVFILSTLLSACGYKGNSDVVSPVETAFGALQTLVTDLSCDTDFECVAMSYPLPGCKDGFLVYSLKNTDAQDLWAAVAAYVQLAIPDDESCPLVDAVAPPVVCRDSICQRQ